MNGGRIFSFLESSWILRVDPQLKEANPQLPQGYLKWLKPLQGYISKLSNGERDWKRRITPNL
jgi:hypothetical protein